MLEKTPFRLAPGQSRSLAFHVSAKAPLTGSFSFQVTYAASKSSGCVIRTTISHKFSVRSLHNAHKVTFFHPGGIVSYAILRPPSKKVVSEMFRRQSLPILLNLHGAGLEADSHQVRHMLECVPDLHAWVLFPTGGSPWSADDWHTWGFADVEAAIAVVGEWTKNVSWEGPSVDISRWLVSGHSNGGECHDTNKETYTDITRPGNMVCSYPSP